MLDLYSCESQLLWKLSLMDNSPLNKQLQNQQGFRITSCRQGKWKWQSEDCKGLFKSVYWVIFSADLPRFFFTGQFISLEGSSSMGCHLLALGLSLLSVAITITAGAVKLSVISSLIHTLINSILSWYFTHLVSVLFRAHFEYSKCILSARGSHWDVHDIYFP